MKVLRLVGLAFAGAAAAFAQIIFDRTTLDGFFPAWVLGVFPRLSGMERWLNDDLRTLAVWLSVAAALTFGLVVPPWRGAAPRRTVGATGATAGLTPGAQRGPALLLGLAALAALAAAGLAWAGRGAWLAALFWLVGTVLAVGVGRVADRLFPPRTVPVPQGRPERSWPWLVAIALLAALLASRDRAALPGVIPLPAAAAASQALNVAAGTGPGWLERGSAAAAGLATLPAAAFTRIAWNPLRGAATAGALAAALLAAGVWLLGCELFRRRPVADSTPAPGAGWVEDDGRLPALLAALALAASAPLMHMGRFAGQVEPLAVGVFGLWATLRGARTGRRGLIGLGAALAALAAGMAPGGVVLLAVAALLWPGIWLLRGAWLNPRAGGLGAHSVGYWFTVAAIAGLPFLAARSHAPAAQAGALDPGFLAGLGRSFLGFVALPDAGGWAAFPLHMLSNWLAPFFILALGALLFSFDSLPGWTLVLWLVIGVAGAATRSGAPSWHALLPTLPAAALAVAFALDRTRAALAANAGAWAVRPANYLAAGVVGLAALTTWAGYSWAAAPGDSASALARAALAAPQDAPLLLMASSAQTTPGWDEPRLLDLATHRATFPNARLRLDADAPENWPERLPARSLVFIPPELYSSIEDLEVSYGFGTLETMRDGRANPVLHIWAAQE